MERKDELCRVVSGSKKVAYTKKESQPLQLTLQRFTFNNAAKVSISFETAMPAHRLLRILNLKALLSRSDKAVVIIALKYLCLMVLRYISPLSSLRSDSLAIYLPVPQS